MALTVTQGPLPNDGERVDASTFLETWVNNSTIRNLPITAFDIAFNWITSQTDTPGDRRGLLWFERGAGQLWVRDDPDRGDSRYTASLWCGLAPVRHTVVGVTRPCQPGDVLIGYDPLNNDNLAALYRDVNGRQTRQKIAVAGNGDLLFNYHYLAAESAPSGYQARAVEWGFAPCRVCTGLSQAPGLYARFSVNVSLLDYSTDIGGKYVVFSRANGWSGETNFLTLGLTVFSSAATNAVTPSQIYKRPTTDYGWYL